MVIFPQGGYRALAGRSRNWATARPRMPRCSSPVGPQQWELRVAVRGAAADSCLTACVPGMRPLQFPDFNLGRGYQPLPPSVRWTYKLGPVLHSATTDIYYYSGWPSVRLRVIDGQDSRDFPLAGVGPGRTREETLWHICLPTEDFTRRWGFLLLGPHDEVDRPPDGTLYRPLASSRLSDGRGNLPLSTTPFPFCPAC